MREEEIEALRSELEAIEERLADLSMDLLREAMADDDPKASPPARLERVITRARRSVAKAAQLLGGASQDEEL